MPTNVLRLLSEDALHELGAAFRHTDPRGSNAGKVEAEICRRQKERYSAIRSSEAHRRGLTRDCVQILRDLHGRAWSFHLRTGLCWPSAI